MAQWLMDWHLAAAFLTALLSPGWGALCAGIFAGLGAEAWPAAAAAGLGGFLRDAFIYMLAARGRWLPRRSVHAPAAAVIGLQSIHLFRWDLAASAGSERKPAIRFLAGLLAASAVLAAAGAALANFILSRIYPGELGLFEARQSLPGLLLLALLASETLRIVLERQIERME